LQLEKIRQRGKGRDSTFWVKIIKVRNDKGGLSQAKTRQ